MLEGNIVFSLLQTFQVLFFFLAMFTLQDGFDFVLSYFDDPKTNFPSYCMNILTSTSKSMQYLLWIQ